MPKLLPKRLSDPRILDHPLLPKRKRSASASDAKLDLIYDYDFKFLIIVSFWLRYFPSNIGIFKILIVT